MKTFLMWIGIAVVIGFVITILVRTDNKNNTTRSAEILSDIFSLRDDDHIRGGSANAPVVIIEYSDFQCPACSSAHTLFDTLEADFGDDVAFVYRHFPLTLIHRNADEAARAAEAAAQQGQFWVMHDKLFETQPTWSSITDIETQFADYAQGLGLDRTQFLIDYKSAVVKDRVEHDDRSAKALGLTGTPSIFINGMQIATPRTKDALYARIKTLLKESDGGALEVSDTMETTPR